MLWATREKVKNRDDPGTSSLVAKVAGPLLDLSNGRAPPIIDAGSRRSCLRRTADGRAVWHLWSHESDRTRGGLSQPCVRPVSDRASNVQTRRVWGRDQSEDTRLNSSH